MAKSHSFKRAWLRAGVATLVLCAGGAIAWMATAAEGAQTGRSMPAGPSSSVIARGKYLLTASDCVACHTAQGGQPLAGGRPMATPFGTIYTPNITPDRLTGIGKWTEAQFWTAVHDGVNADGKYLYPVFPFTNYTRMPRADVDAIFAYLKTVKPVRKRNRPLDMAFPFSVRESLLGWRTMFFKKGVYTPDPDKSAAWNRGAYLVEGPGHCTACHTQRNMLGATEKGKRLAGGIIPIQNWYAPNLLSGKGGGLNGWTEQDVVDLLKSGRSSRGTVYGPMAEVVRNSTQYMTDADLKAIAGYLMSLPSQPPSKVESIEPPEAEVADMVERGRAVYKHECSRCHQDGGEGVAHVYPPLNANSSIIAPTPVNAIRMVLLGGFEVPTRVYPRPYSMPPFAQKLSDRDVAAVVTYIRQAWDNDASAVAPATVRRYRSNSAP
jgi:mono/diheme cytochrome c family protein